MKIAVSFLACLILGFPLTVDRVSAANPNAHDQKYASQQDKLAPFARCLSEKGYRMYSSFTCSHCRAQRKSFGDAFEYINEIECNPAASNTQVELCLKKKIRKLPTWTQEIEGKELIRLESYQPLKVLSASSGCHY